MDTYKLLQLLVDLKIENTKTELEYIINISKLKRMAILEHHNLILEHYNELIER